MKYFLILFTIITTSINAQDALKFDKKNFQCEDKWVAFQKSEDDTYMFGFIYIDAQAGLTLNHEGNFKIDSKGRFIRVDEETKNDIGFMKARLEPSNVAIAEIPESKFKELKIEKTPDWLKTYKQDENSLKRLYRWGYMYNGWSEFEKALTYLEKAEKIEPNFAGLQTELAFSYNALGEFEKAEKSLKKAIANDPKDCYAYKELAFANTKMLQLEKAIETYNTMAKICSEKDYIRETAYNLA